LNRFTKDQSQADENLPITLFDVLQSAFYCISVLLLICISIPYLIILMPLLIYMFNFARNKYLINSIEIKRLEAISRSPIYVDFSSALEGLMTLRGYRLENSANKSFQQQLDRNSRAWFSFLMVSSWLGFRLDLESSVMLICVVFVAVALRDTIDIGLIGFTIIYTLSLSGLLQWTVRQVQYISVQSSAVYCSCEACT
jgi:ATP-binding cassette, subfamily C (CFTR/MRP), member 4